MKFRSIVTQLVIFTFILPILFTPAVHAQTTIRLWHPHTGDRQLTLERLIDQFNRENDQGITVEAVSFDDPGLLYDQIILQLTTSTDLPHLIMVWPHEAALFDLTGIIVDLSAYGSSTGFERGFNPNTHKQLGIPDRTFVELMAVNLDALHEMGYSQPPTTMALLEEMACRFERWSGGRFGNTWGFLMPTDIEFLSGISGLLIDNAQVVIDTPPRRHLLQTLINMHREGCITSVQNSFDAIDAFAQGQTLFFMGSSSSLPILHERIEANFAQPFEWRVYPLPGQPTAVAFGPIISMIDHGPTSNDAAWDFIEWFISPDIHRIWIEATLGLPVTPVSIEAFPQWQQAVQLDTISMPALAGYGVVRLEIQFALQRLLAGTSTLEQELPALETLTNQILSDFAGEAVNDEQS